MQSVQQITWTHVPWKLCCPYPTRKELHAAGAVLPTAPPCCLVVTQWACWSVDLPLNILGYIRIYIRICIRHICFSGIVKDLSWPDLYKPLLSLNRRAVIYHGYRTWAKYPVWTDGAQWSLTLQVSAPQCQIWSTAPANCWASWAVAEQLSSSILVRCAQAAGVTDLQVFFLGCPLSKFWVTEAVNLCWVWLFLMPEWGHQASQYTVLPCAINSLSVVKWLLIF